MNNSLIIQIGLFMIAYIFDIFKVLSIAKGVIAEKAKYIHEGEIPYFKDYISFKELFIYLNRRLSIFFIFGILVLKETNTMHELNKIERGVIGYWILTHLIVTIIWSYIVYKNNKNKKIDEIYTDTITHI